MVVLVVYRKGENVNDQILTRPSCAYLLGNYSRSGEGPQSYLMTLQIFSLGGVFDNVQISTTLRCAYLLANPGKHVPLGGVFDKARIFIHIQIWLSFCKSSSAHEVKIASTSVHGCGGGASGGAGGVVVPVVVLVVLMVMVLLVVLVVEVVVVVKVVGVRVMVVVVVAASARSANVVVKM